MKLPYLRTGLSQHILNEKFCFKKIIKGYLDKIEVVKKKGKLSCDNRVLDNFEFDYDLPDMTIFGTMTSIFDAGTNFSIKTTNFFIPHFAINDFNVIYSKEGLKEIGYNISARLVDVFDMNFFFNNPSILAQIKQDNYCLSNEMSTYDNGVFYTSQKEGKYVVCFPINMIDYFFENIFLIDLQDRNNEKFFKKT